jgi:pimeloyl-ACP methyl ester carboxylesterase
MLPDLPEPRSAFIETAGGRLHYLSHGDPSAPPLLLIHGMRDHARSWDAIATVLAGRYHVVAPDLRGHGDSFWAEAHGYALSAFVFDLADLNEALGLRDVVLVGHSLGGAIAIRYAAAFPDRVRALCAIEGVELPIVRDERNSPTPYPARLRSWFDAERGRRSRVARGYDTLAEAEARMAEGHPDIDSAQIAHFARQGVRLGSDGQWRWKYDNGARLRAPDDADGRDLDQILAAIACPTLLAYGDASWIPLPPPERLALLRDHRVAIFPGAGHWLHHTARDSFLAALIPFLDASTEGQTHA